MTTKEFHVSLLDNLLTENCKIKLFLQFQTDIVWCIVAEYTHTRISIRSDDGHFMLQFQRTFPTTNGIVKNIFQDN